MIRISGCVFIPLNEIELLAIRAQGAGGQNVNKVSSAIHLRFDIHASSLPNFHKQRLLQLRDKRITKDGIINIMAQMHRTQEMNKKDALERLQNLIINASKIIKKRIKTKATRGSQRRRLEGKKQRSQIKNQRQNKNYLD